MASPSGDARTHGRGAVGPLGQSQAATHPVLQRHLRSLKSASSDLRMDFDQPAAPGAPAEPALLEHQAPPVSPMVRPPTGASLVAQEASVTPAVRRPAAPRPGRAGNTEVESNSTRPSVQVSIGRVDVRAVFRPTVGSLRSDSPGEAHSVARRLLVPAPTGEAMSNYLAIATVTAALQQILQGPVRMAVSGANVGFNRPNGKGGGHKGPVVNIYLYRVTPNAAYRNVDLPTRRADGTVVQKPQTALDLHYLLTFHGNDDKLEPQLMLGAVASTLDAQPLLSTQSIQAAVTQFGFLTGSGVDSQVERVRFTPTALSLEDFTKLWSAFFQVEYSLSAAYQASVVLIESGDSAQEGLPVQARNLYVVPFQQPAITSVISRQAGASQPILPTSTW